MSRQYDVELNFEFKMSFDSERHAELGVDLLMKEIEDKIEEYAGCMPDKSEYVIDERPEYEEILFGSVEEE